MNSKTAAKSRYLRSALTVLGATLGFGAVPGIAAAHGPIAPVATSYLAKVGSTPRGLEAKVIDGDQRLWLRAPPNQVVVVLDYRGAAYLRFSRSGVEVNRESAMYYLNQSPAQTPPPNLTPATPPRWHVVSSGHDYNWHDGRLHALATVALAPGATYVGRWTIPVVIDGAASAVSGGVWYAGSPSLAWLWPIVVLVACVLAARRLRRPALNTRLARLMGASALIATAIAGAGRELHGRPAVGVGQAIVLAVIVAFCVWAMVRLVLGRRGYFLLFVIAFVALWAGGSLVPVLFHGFVLMAVPAFVARAAAVACFGCGAGLFLIVLAMMDQPGSGASRTSAPVDEKVAA
jgi:hypothetical protein